MTADTPEHTALREKLADAMAQWSNWEKKYDEARNQLASAQTALKEARRDSERLDWLQSQSVEGFLWGVRRYPATYGCGMYQIIQFVEGDKTLFSDVRAALDAALARAKALETFPTMGNTQNHNE